MKKVRGVLISQAPCNAFINCINDCNLVDNGFSYQGFTWLRGNLRERLDRVLSNAS